MHNEPVRHTGTGVASLSTAYFKQTKVRSTSLLHSITYFIILERADRVWGVLFLSFFPH